MKKNPVHTLSLCLVSGLMMMSPEARADQDVETLRLERERLIELVLDLEGSFADTLTHYRDLQQSYRTLREETAHMVSPEEVERLQAKLKEAADHLAQNQADKAATEAQRDRLTEHQALLHQDLQNLRRELHRERASLAETQERLSDIAKLEEKITSLQKTIDETGAEELKGLVEVLKKEKAQLEASLDQSQQELTKERKARQDAEKKAEQLAKQSQELEGQVQSLRQEMSGLQKKSGTLEKEVKTISTQKSELEAKLSASMTQHEQLSQQLATLQESDQAQRKIHDDLKTQVTKLGQDKAQLEQSLTQTKSTLAQKEKDLQAIQAETQENESIREELKKKDSELGKLRKELGQLHLKSQVAEKQLVGLKMRVAEILPVTYALGASDVAGQQERVLADIQECLAMFPKAQFEIVGHTCDLGDRDKNKSLSQSRAESLKSFLIDNGIPAQILSARGEGDATPLVPNTSNENRQKNRRVEILILD